MLLSDSAILEAIDKGEITIAPFDRDSLGTNSYDVHLSKHLSVYDNETLDARAHNTVTEFEIPKEGYVLEPGKLYLGSTLEYNENFRYVPFLDGKSSTGRLGIFIHATAGVGDVGFCNHWTLEIVVVQPVRVYANMPIGQLTFLEVKGDVINPYNKKKDAKYNALVSKKPLESMMWKNQF